MVMGGAALRAPQWIGLLLSGAVLLASCGQKQGTIKNKQSNSVIVQTKTQSLDQIQTLFPTKTVKIINKKDGIYKIQDTLINNVKTQMPDAYAEQDNFINVLHPDFENDPLKAFEKKSDIGDDIKALHCVKGANAPQSQIALVSQNDFVTDNVVRVGSASLIIQAIPAQDQKAQDWNPGPNFLSNPLDVPWMQSLPANLEYHWYLQGPAATQSALEGGGDQFTINPDRPGGYEILLITQDPATKLCSGAHVTVGATWDQVYGGPQNNPGEYNAGKFFHDPLVRAPEAWAISQGEGMTIAVIDSGINYNHPDLADNIKINAGEIPANQIDDDNNGLIDDVYGWDFADGDSSPFDDESHGTHVSGLAAAENFGIARKAKILPVKSIMATGMATTSSLVSGIYYAIEQKADVISMSLGGEGKASPILLAALKKAQEAGILLVVASGNSKEDTDAIPSHFTAADGPNVLAVAATDENDQLTEYSNYGATTVQIAAPGGSVLNPINSTYAWTDLASYIGYPGTSMATPIVAGAAAIVKAINPKLSPEQIIQIISESGRSAANLIGKVSSGKVLDVAAAAAAAQATLQGVPAQN